MRTIIRPHPPPPTHMAPPTYRCPLPWRAIRVSGADADSFLNGQLTASVPPPGDTRCRLAGYCMPNGRMLALLWMWRDNGALHLAMPCDVTAPTLQRLRLFVLRSDVQFEELDTSPVGLVGDINAPDTPGNSGLRVALGAAPDGDAALWEQACIDAGIANIVAATRERVIPQMIGLEQLGGLDYRKGCYPGQEIIARLHYKGTLKQRMYRVALPDAPPPGTPLRSDDRDSGLVLAASASHALVLARVDDAGKTLQLGDSATDIALPEQAVFPDAR